MIQAFIIFIIVPLMLGRIVAKRETITFRYPIGFLTMLSVFYAIYLVTYYTHHSVHVMYYMFLIFVCAAALAWLIFFARRAGIFSEVQRLFLEVKSHPSWLIFFAIAAIQVYRMVAYTQINYSDDDTYIPMIADMIATDKFYIIYSPDGSFASSAYEIPQKYALSGWLAFEAVLSRFTGLHPLILVKTVLPIAEIFLHYCIFIRLAKLFLKKDDSYAFFMIVYSLLLEVGWTATTTTLSYYFLTWLWYGKAFVEFIIIPFMLAVWLSDEDITLMKVIWLLIISASGAAASMMGVVLVVTETGFLTLASMIRKRSLRPAILGIITLIPEIVVSGLYLLM